MSTLSPSSYRFDAGAIPTTPTKKKLFGAARDAFAIMTRRNNKDQAHAAEVEEINYVELVAIRKLISANLRILHPEGGLEITTYNSHGRTYACVRETNQRDWTQGSVAYDGRLYDDSDEEENRVHVHLTLKQSFECLLTQTQMLLSARRGSKSTTTLAITEGEHRGESDTEVDD